MRRILPLHTRVFASCCLAAAIAALVSVGAQQTAIAGGVSVSGELRQWHKVTLTLDGPQAAETDIAPTRSSITV